MEKPSVSILLSCFRGDLYIESYVESLLSNKCIDNLILIAIDFPFSHDSPSFVESQLKRIPNLQHIKFDYNISLYNAWNFAIRCANTEFVTNLNLDDRVTDDYYEYGVRMLRSYKADIFSSFAIITDKVGDVSENSAREKHLDDDVFGGADVTSYSLPDIFYFNESKLVKKSIPHCAPIWRRSLHRNNGFFNSRKFDFAADTEFWARCAAAGAQMIVSRTYRTIFYCAPGTVSDRLLHQDNAIIVEKLSNTFPPKNYKETHLGRNHDLLHHAMNFNVLLSDFRYYSHVKNHPQVIAAINSLKQLPKSENIAPNKKPNLTELTHLQKEKVCIFKNIHIGKKALLICNGPSLNDVDFAKLNLDDYIVFGLNKIFLGYEKFGFQADYIAAVNPKVIEQSASDLASLPIPKFISNRSVHPDLDSSSDDNVFYIKTTPLPKSHQRFSNDISDYVHEGWTVTHVALQILFYMGVDEVNIVGMDHRFKQHVSGQENKESIIEDKDIDHFDPSYFGNGQSWDFPDLENSELSYKAALKAYSDNGRSIWDCTINGACNIFPKKDIQELYDNSVFSDDLISIIIPAYNAEDYLALCLESVFNQNYKNIEVIVVDDGSTDETKNIVKKFNSQQSNIILTTNQRKKGVSGARNTGLDIANGKFITFLDADDFYLPGALRTRKELLNQRPDFNVSFCGIKFVGENGTDLNLKLSTQEIIEYKEFYKCPLQMTTPLFRREAIEEKRFNEELHNGEDFLFLAKIAQQQKKFIGTGKLGLAYRVHDKSAVVGNFIKHVDSLEEAFKRVYMDYSASGEVDLLKWPNIDNVLYERRFSAAVYCVLAGDQQAAHRYLIKSGYFQDLDVSSVREFLEKKIPFTIMRKHGVAINQYKEYLNHEVIESSLLRLASLGGNRNFIEGFRSYLLNFGSCRVPSEKNAQGIFFHLASNHFVYEGSNTWRFTPETSNNNHIIAYTKFWGGLKGVECCGVVKVRANEHAVVHINIGRHGKKNYEGNGKEVELRPGVEEYIKISHIFQKEYSAVKIQLHLVSKERQSDLEIRFEPICIFETPSSFKKRNQDLFISLQNANKLLRNQRAEDAWRMYSILYAETGWPMIYENILLAERWAKKAEARR